MEGLTCQASTCADTELIDEPNFKVDQDILAIVVIDEDIEDNLTFEIIIGCVGLLLIVASCFISRLLNAKLKARVVPALELQPQPLDPNIISLPESQPQD